MRAARFELSVELLNRALHLPARSWIGHIEMEPNSPTATVTVIDPQLPEADEPHAADPVITEHRVEWDWGIR